MTRLNRLIQFKIVFFSTLFLLGLLYVSQTWSPSSYGIMLRELGYRQSGLIFSRPQTIRSDEWAVSTPMIQATVNNGFRRYNATSFYNEDLRLAYTLPLSDWGIIFKPHMWLYPFVNAAYAFSFQYYATFALFVIGYWWLFRIMGAKEGQALALSLGIYFTGFVQFWWTTLGMGMAVFPFVVAVLFAKIPRWQRVILFYWVASVWLISDFYPPLCISLGFVAAIFLLCFGAEWFTFKRLSALFAATALACCTTLYYLKDYLLATMATMYPGQRSVSGGGVPLREFISQILPFTMYDKGFRSLDSQNICEAGTVGLFVILLAICFANYSQLWKRLKEPKIRRRATILGIGLFLMLGWMIAPIPAGVGKLLLWNNVQPERMEFAEGLLAVLFAFYLVSVAGWVVNAVRIMLFLGVIFAGWYVLKLQPGFSAGRNSLDVWIVLPLLVAYALIRKNKVDPGSALLVVSLAVSAVVLFKFNPIQKAWPIFNREETAEVVRLREMVNPRTGLLSVNEPGATANGLGFKSVTHVTMVPAWQVWNKFRDRVPSELFNNVFNRYSHIQLSNDALPKLIQADLITVPRSWFPGAELEIKAK
jgi:hypothetical protein